MKKFHFYYFSVIIFLLLTYNARSQWIQNDLSNSDTVMSFAQKYANLFAATNSGVFLSNDNGLRWIVKNSGLNYPPAYVIVFSDSNIFAATSNGVFKSDNNAESWSSVSNGLGYQYIRSMTISNKNLYAGTMWGGVFISTNNGANWTAINSGLTDKWITNLATSYKGTGSNNIFAGTPSGVFIYNGNNAKWTLVNNGPKNTSVSSLAVNDTIIFAGTSKGIFISNDNGINWTLVNDTLTYVKAFAFTNTNFFFGSDRGIFRSSVNFTSWSDISDNLTNKFVTSLIISGSKLIAGTWGFGSGIWNRPLSEVVTSVSSSSGKPPVTFSLEQNYPNPFNPTTNIGFQIAGFGFVSLKVYDVLGREVAALVNEFKPSGRYSVAFNASDLPSGIYLYRLKVNDFAATKKLILLK